MKNGVQLAEKMNREDIEAAGFSCCEILYQGKDELKKLADANVYGIVIELARYTADDLLGVAEFAAKRKCYILLDTRNVSENASLDAFVKKAGSFLAEQKIPLYIENGYIKSAGQYSFGAFSEADSLLAACEKLELSYPGIEVGVAVDIGIANVLVQNTAEMLRRIGKHLALVHANDNNGSSCQKQMPFTFTAGRGLLTTNWNQILGSLMKIGFDGFFIYNTTGLYETVPETLLPEMFRLQKALADRFEQQFHFEDFLSREGKQIVLFGAGAMATNYMQTWGEKYPPVFVVDNNAKRWGESFQGITIKNPEEILELDEEKRVVIICNMYYNEIRKQLTEMGVNYAYYNDEFY